MVLVEAIHRLCRCAELISAALMPSAGSRFAARWLFRLLSTEFAIEVSVAVAAPAAVPASTVPATTAPATVTAAIATHKTLWAPAVTALRSNIHRPLTPVPLTVGTQTRHSRG